LIARPRSGEYMAAPISDSSSFLEPFINTEIPLLIRGVENSFNLSQISAKETVLFLSLPLERESNISKKAY